MTALVACTFAVPSVLVPATVVTTLSATAAWADGGDGGDGANLFNSGGAGGTTGNPGARGSDGNVTRDGGGGGGGGGAGSIGGLGGLGAFNAGDGGKGGNGGAILTTENGPNAGAVTFSGPATASAGGAGENGEDGVGGGGGGGGGGAGGIAVILTGGAFSDVTVSGVLTGGAGGAGGSGGAASDSIADGGDGGEDGDGGAAFVVRADAAGSVIVNDGTLQGGAGGAGGAAGASPWQFNGARSGFGGQGGAGLIATGITLTNNGTIAGGLGGNGVRGNAIQFLGGSNTITFGNATDGLTGNINIAAGSLTFDQSALDTTVDSQISGAGSVVKTGTATITFINGRSYSGTTTISQGTLKGGSPGFSRSSFSANSAHEVAAGATLDLGGFDQTIGSLAGAGTVTNSEATAATLTTNGDNSDTVFSGVIQDGAGTTGLNKIGSGTLTLSGANTYSGATTVTAGTLQGGAANSFSAASAHTVTGTLDLGGFSQAIGSLAGAGTVTSSVAGDVTLTTNGDNSDTVFSGVIENGVGTVALTKAGTGTLTLSGTNTYSGGTDLAAGTLQVENAAALGTGTLTFTGDATLRGNANVTIANDITGVSGASPTISAAAGTELTLAPNAFRYQGGAGTTLHFGTATDTGIVTVGITGFAGPTTGGAASVDGGTLRMGNTYTGLDLLDSLDGGVNIASGATLDINGFRTNVAGLTGSGEVTNNGDDAAVLWAYNASSSTFSGVLKDGTAALGLTKFSLGELTLTGANTYTGTTAIREGTLKGGAENSFSAASLHYVTTTLDLGGFDQIIGSLGGIGTVTSSVAGDVTLTTNGDNSDTTFSGVIEDGAGTVALTKAGTGTLTLSGANTYSGGTTISAGTLRVENGQALSDDARVNVNGGTLQVATDEVIGSLSGTGGSVNIAAGQYLTVGNDDTSTTFAGTLGGDGSLEKIGSGTLTLTGVGSSIGGELLLCACAPGGIDINGGTLSVGGPISLFSSTLSVTNGGMLSQLDSSTGIGLDAASVEVSGANSVMTIAGVTFVGGLDAGTMTISAGGVVNSQNGAEISSFVGSSSVTVTGADSVWNVEGGISVGTFGAGTLTVADGGHIAVTGTTDTVVINDGSTLKLGIGGLAGTIATSQITLNGAGSAVVADFTDTATVAADIVGDGSLTKNGTGTLILTSDLNSYSGGTTIGGGTLQLGNGGASGFIAGDILNNGVLAVNRALGSSDISLDGVISGNGALRQLGGGTTILTAANTYTGATTVDAGVLIVNGSIASSSMTTVNAGGMLGGSGTVGNTSIVGGTLSPGNSIDTLNVSGNLSFDGASTYAVEVSPSAADRTDVTGTAILAGTVTATLEAGSYVVRTYTILSAIGGLGGTTFDTLNAAGVPANFALSLDYTATDVLLNLTAALAQNTPVNPNQQKVADAINKYFNNGGVLPPNFVNLFGLTGDALANALSQASGETATGAQQGAFKIGGQFLSLLLNPFIVGRGGAADDGALGYAPERAALPEEVQRAYAKALNEPAGQKTNFARRWNVWGSVYGGYNRTDGAVDTGSNDVTVRTGGVAVGADYRVTPNTMIGFALGGGGTNWSTAGGLGSGDSDAFQAGVYGTTQAGPVYLAGTLAFTNYWMSTDRTGPFNNKLTADFDAQSFGARIEGGYRFGTPATGITPYAALQAQRFHTQGYSETDESGGGFGLTYDARTATATRAELGARFDHVTAASADSVLALYGRLAWAHDWNDDSAMTATFQSLPGASFVVSGATPAEDSLLASLGAELRLANGVSLAAKADGEFSGQGYTLAGTGTLRITW